MHTREHALRRRHDVTMQSLSSTPTSPTSTSTPTPVSLPGLPAASAAQSHSCMREAFGDDCFT